MLLNSRRNTGKKAKEFVEKKLMRRLRLFIIIFLVLLCFIVYEVFKGYVDPALAFGASLFGLMLGGTAVRRKKISWNEETSQVIARMDRIGIFILIIYILFSVLRHYLFRYWFSGNMLTAFSLSFAAGAMLGRLLSMRAQIREILRERDII
jgi:predicted membrane channel-forming protein YqfA (hemolysin III family)